MALYNYDQAMSGIYRAILLRSSSDPNARVYIPSILNNNIPCPVYNDGMLNETVYKNNINSYLIATFCNFELASSSSFAIPCWVTFETGNINYPIVVGYFANSWFPGTLNLMGVTNTNPDFRIFEYKDWCYPMSIRTSIPVMGAARHFGAPRSGTSRRHAAIDLIIEDTSNTKIIACTNGTVLENNVGFYEESDNDLQIKNTDGSILRYCEISSNLQVGAHVNRGDIIGSAWINSSGNSMLHIELYEGNEIGPLSQLDYKGDYLYVTDLYYARRKDLRDPSFIENLPLIDELLAREQERQNEENNNNDETGENNQENNNEGDEE